MDWKDKLGQAQKMFEDAKAILSNPESTSDQKEGVAAMLEDARKLKNEALQYKDVLEEGLKIMEMQNAKTEEFQTKEKTPESSKLFNDMEEYMLAVWNASRDSKRDPRLVYFKDQESEGHEGKALTGAAGSSGGFLIPTQFIATVQAVQGEDVIMRKAGATVIRMASRQVQLPVLDQTDTTEGYPHWFGGMKFFWHEEAQEKTESEPTFRMVNLVAKKMIGLTHASDEVITDSAVSLADFITGPMGMAGGIAWMEDFSFIRGTGGAQPLGVLNSPAKIITPRVQMGSIDYVDIIEMYSQFLPSGRGIWLASQSVMPDIIQMKGPEGNPSYVWQPNARDGIVGTIFGMPVYWSEKMPRKGKLGDLALVDPRYYLIGDRQATTIETTPYARWIYDQTSWRAVHRVDGQSWLSAPLTYEDGETQVSPIVVLGSTQGT